MAGTWEMFWKCISKQVSVVGRLFWSTKGWIFNSGEGDYSRDVNLTLGFNHFRIWSILYGTKKLFGEIEGGPKVDFCSWIVSLKQFCGPKKYFQHHMYTTKWIGIKLKMMKFTSIRPLCLTYPFLRMIGCGSITVMSCEKSCNKNIRIVCSWLFYSNSKKNC